MEKGAGCTKGLSFSLKPSQECNSLYGVCACVCAHTGVYTLKKYSLNNLYVPDTVQCPGVATENKEHVVLCPCSLTVWGFRCSSAQTVTHPGLSTLSEDCTKRRRVGREGSGERGDGSEGKRQAGEQTVHLETIIILPSRAWMPG